MNKIDKKKVDKLIHSLGLKYGLSDSNIKEIVESPYLFADNKLAEENSNINSAKTKEEINNLKTTFLFKSFFKLFISKSKLLKRNQQRNIINKVNKDRWNK